MENTELKNLQKSKNYFDKTEKAVKIYKEFQEKYCEITNDYAHKLQTFIGRFSTSCTNESPDKDTFLIAKILKMTDIVSCQVSELLRMTKQMSLDTKNLEEELATQKIILSKASSENVIDATKDLEITSVELQKAKEDFFSCASKAEDSIINYQMAIKSIKAKNKDLTMKDIKEMDKVRQLYAEKENLLHLMEQKENIYRAKVKKANENLKAFVERVEPGINISVLASWTMAKKLKDTILSYYYIFREVCTVLSGNLSTFLPIIDNKKGFVEETIFEDCFKEKILNSFIKTSSKKKFHSEPYHIKILSNLKALKEQQGLTVNQEPTENEDKSKGIIKRQKTLSQKLSLEDIHETVKQLYQHLRNLSKSDYDLEKEEKTLSTIKICKQILTNVEVKDNKEKEINELKKLFEDSKYRVLFLQRLNEMRVKGIFKIPNKNFEIIGILLNLILDNVLTDADLYSSKNVIILSQTFYIQDNEKSPKTYLISRIVNHPIYKNKKFWEDFIEYSIQMEFGSLKVDGSSASVDESMSHTNNIVFSQLIPITDNMIEFGVGKEMVKEIIDPFIEKYSISKPYEEMIYEIMNKSPSINNVDAK